MARPRPQATPLMAPFWQAAREGRLVAPECTSCRRRHWGPEAACPYCGATWVWQPSPGRGALYSFSVVYRGATPEFEVPYVLALVDLDDGWTMKTNMPDLSEDDLYIGMRVQVQFCPIDDEFTLPLFAPDRSPA